MRRRMKAKLTIHTGSMFSGKTEGLIRDLKRYQYAKRKVQVFKPSKDDRYSITSIVSHSGEIIEAIAIEDIRDIMKHLSADTEVIGIEEITLFNQTYILNVVNALLEMGIVVTVAGLDMDFRGKPFGVMPQLMAMAETPNKYRAVCSECGDDAWCSYRLSDNKELVVVGEKDEYTPLCRQCYNKKTKQRK